MTKLSADAVVIGGGAAGMMCSLIAARRGLDVILLEPNKMLGRKLRITGKGRCNVTNNCDIKEFLTNIPGDGRFLYSALNRLSPRDTMQFFESLGLPLKQSAEIACFRCPTTQTMLPERSRAILSAAECVTYAKVLIILLQKTAKSPA